MGTWLKKARAGEIDTGSGTRTPEESLNLAEQLQAANKRIKELEKANRELEELNEFLEEASAFSLRAVGSRERRTVKVYCIKAIPHKVRLTALHIICLHLCRIVLNLRCTSAFLTAIKDLSAA